MPRAAMSVATRMRSSPSRKAPSARSRWPWLLLPWIAADLMPDDLELAHDLVGAVLGAGEDDGALHLGNAQRLRQQRRLLAGLGEDHALVDLLGRGRDGRDRNLDRIGEIGRGDLADRLRHGRREQQGLALGRDQGGDPAQRMDEAEIEHLVGLVEDEELDLAQRDGALVDEVEQAAGRGDEDVDMLAERADLLADGHAAEDHGRLDRGEVGIGADRGLDLRRELAGRRQDQRTHRARPACGAAG